MLSFLENLKFSRDGNLMSFYFAIFLLFSFFINTFALDPVYVALIQHNKQNDSSRANIHHKLNAPIRPQQSGPNPLDYSLPQLKEYFADQDYTEAQILSENTLYMSDEFVKLAKTYSGYEAAISSLHKKIDQMGFAAKAWHWIRCKYSPGLDKRIRSLYTEIQKNKATKHQPIHKQQTTKVLPQCQKQLISILESHTDQVIVIEAIDQLAHQVFNQAEQYHYPIDIHIENALDTSLDILRVTSNPEEFIFHTAFVDHVLCDIEERTTEAAPATLLERSPKLLARALTTFVKGLNPITQVKNTCEFIISTARFVADVTLGKLYLSETQYKDRINNFWTTCEALSPSNLAKLEAEQWVDLVAQCAADVVFFGGVSKAVSYLKKLEAVSSAHKQATRIAQKFKHAVDISLAEEPLVVMAEGYVLRASSEVKQVGGAAKEIITDSKALLESACTGLLADLEKEMAHLRMLCDRKVKGFAESSNKYLKPDYKHILGMDLSFSKRGIPQIDGFHHDIMNCLENSGIVEFRNKVIYENGFYRATLLYNGEVVKKIATFFPAHWSREQVINKIYEAYNNFIQSGMKPVLEPSGKYKIDVLLNEQLNICMYITKDGTIKTVYPILK